MPSVGAPGGSEVFTIYAHSDPPPLPNEPAREVTGWEQVRPEEREYTEEVRGSEV